MTPWTSIELSKIEMADELQLTSLRANGTPREAVTVWVVRVGDGIYVRAYKGRHGPWFRGVQARHEGHIQAGGVQKDVTFVEELNPAINNQIDAAYRLKYRQYSAQYVEALVTAEARAATLQLVPRLAGS